MGITLDKILAIKKLRGSHTVLLERYTEFVKTLAEARDLYEEEVKGISILRDQDPDVTFKYAGYDFKTDFAIRNQVDKESEGIIIISAKWGRDEDFRTVLEVPFGIAGEANKVDLDVSISEWRQPNIKDRTWVFDVILTSIYRACFEPVSEGQTNSDL